MCGSRVLLPFHAFCLAVALAGSPALAQCDDADGDGYCYEVGCFYPAVCDCNDADPNIHTAGIEICDGLDNDCDGLVDNDPTCPLTCDFPEVISRRTVIPYARETKDDEVRVVWTGREFGLVWEKHLREEPYWWEVFFTRLDRAGRQLGDSVRLSFYDGGNVSADKPDLAWTGDQYGVVWTRDDYTTPDVFFTRLDRYGKKLGDDLQVTDTISYSGGATVAWNGREFGVAWSDERDGPGFNQEIYFVRIDADGAKIGSEVRITVALESSWYPNLLWNGSQWALAWMDNRTPRAIYFVTLSADGTKSGSEWPITSMEEVSDEFDLVWTGSGYGLLFSQHIVDPCCSNPLYLQLLDGQGLPIGDPQPISQPDINLGDHIVGISWTGGEYGMSFHEARTGEFEIYHARADDLGNQIGGEVQVSEGPERSTTSDIAWSGRLSGVAYRERPSEQNTNTTIHVGRVRCRCDDADADGTCADVDCNDSDDGVQVPPDEVLFLRFTDMSTLEWDAPADPGAPTTDLVYDTIRSSDAPEFVAGAVCIESNSGPDTFATDSENPPAGVVFYYLVRAENGCPEGQGTLGGGSGGVERVGRVC